MPRAARQISATGVYHIMMRGADRRIIFADDADCEYFLKILRRVKRETGLYIYAYCLMGNHVHLLLKEGKEPLGLVFRRIGSAYAYYYNWKYELHGHLFQDRYRSENVEDDAYFLDVLRYICQNPVKAAMSETPFDYPWLGCGGVMADNTLVDAFENLTDLKGEALKAFVTTPYREEHLEDKGMKRLTDKEAIERICKALGCENVQEIAGWDAKRRNDAIRKTRELGISIRQFSRLTAINKTTIERARR